MKKQMILFSISIFLLCKYSGGMAQNNNQKPVGIKIQVYEAESKKITPVMVCITDIEDDQVLIPPDAAIIDAPSETNVFYSGIEYEHDDNWIGPVRMMNGQGNNENRSYVYDLLPSIPHWKEPVMYQTSGNFTIELQPGRYRLSLEHGNEYVPIVEEFEVSDSASELIKAFYLTRWINLPDRGWYSGDVHVHHPTNKPEFKEFLLEYAKAEDVHLVNVLEMGHHLGRDFKQDGFGKKSRTCIDDICLVSGQEDPRSTFGHIIGLNIEQLERDTSTYDYYDLIFKKLHLQPGAIVGYAHFSWNGCDLPKGFPWYVTTGEIDFVELLQFSKINTLDYYDYLNLGFRITAAAGSDIPWGSTLGEVRTFVYTGNEFSPDAWFEGLKSGNTFVSNGPVLFLEADGMIPGSEIMRINGSVSEITLKAISHNGIGKIERLAIYNNDGIVSEKLNSQNLDSLYIKIKHTLNRSQWLAAVVYCENGAVAHTTPIYFIVDGKPTWDPKKAPGIVEKQLEAIQLIEEETIGKDPVDQGILTRLENARLFYDQLLKEIDNDK
jgi:hypothetical protein